MAAARPDFVRGGKYDASNDAFWDEPQDYTRVDYRLLEVVPSGYPSLLGKIQSYRSRYGKVVVLKGIECSVLIASNKSKSQAPKEAAMESKPNTLMDHVAEGAKNAVAGSASDVAFSLFRTLFASQPELLKLLDTSMGRHFVLCGMAGFTHYTVGAYPNIVPGVAGDNAPLIQEAVGRVIQNEVRDFIQPNMGVIASHFMQFAALAGAQAPALEGVENIGPTE